MIREVYLPRIDSATESSGRSGELPTHTPLRDLLPHWPWGIRCSHCGYCYSSRVDFALPSSGSPPVNPRGNEVKKSNGAARGGGTDDGVAIPLLFDDIPFLTNYLPI